MSPECNIFHWNALCITTSKYWIFYNTVYFNIVFVLFCCFFSWLEIYTFSQIFSVHRSLLCVTAMAETSLYSSTTQTSTPENICFCPTKQEAWVNNPSMGSRSGSCAHRWVPSLDGSLISVSVHVMSWMSRTFLSVSNRIAWTICIPCFQMDL